MPSPVFLPLLLHLRDLEDALTSGFCQFADKNQYRRILGRTSSFSAPAGLKYRAEGAEVGSEATKTISFAFVQGKMSIGQIASPDIRTLIIRGEKLS